MAYWLLKSEPRTWSWQQQLQSKTEPWDGVRNHQAKQHLMAMRVGNLGFFYHSGAERAVVGIVKIVKAYYPDPSDESGKFGMVDVRAVKPLAQPVTLAEIKDEPILDHLVLVHNTRLSVQPVDAAAWKKICRMGGI